MSAIELSFAADVSDGLAHGYPDLIALSGDVVMESWQPVEAVVEARTLRAASDVDGPAIHGRVRTLVQERILLLAPDGAIVEQLSRLLNAVNAGAAAGWLQARRLDEPKTWRPPVRGGSLQLAGSSLRYARGRRYRVTVLRAPWFEDTAAVALGGHALRSGAPVTLTAPDAGTLAAPLVLDLRAAAAVPTALCIHLYQDRAVPAAWTPGYRCAGTGVSGADLRFTTPRPAGKDLGRPALYRPVLAPANAFNTGRVDTHRDDEAFSLAYGAGAARLWGESELGRLGRLDGRASVFTGLGMVALDEETAWLLLRSYARPFPLDSGWQLHNAPVDGHLMDVAGGTGVLAGGPLYLGPSERTVLLPFIEQLGASEYTGTALSLNVSVRPRISELQ